VASIENIMERIVRVTKMNPITVRLNNMNEADKNIMTDMINVLKKSSDYERRLKDVGKFNKVTNIGMKIIMKQYFLETRVIEFLYRKIDGKSVEYL
jgi:xanthine dehydrogenase molybdopterin-binding subunit B